MPAVAIQWAVRGSYPSALFVRQVMKPVKLSATSTGPTDSSVAVCSARGAIGADTDFKYMARVVFGSDLVEAEIERVWRVLAGREGMGYATTGHMRRVLARALGLAMLLNRSPYPEAMSHALFASLVASVASG